MSQKLEPLHTSVENIPAMVPKQNGLAPFATVLDPANIADIPIVNPVSQYNSVNGIQPYQISDRKIIMEKGGGRMS